MRRSKNYAASRIAPPLLRLLFGRSALDHQPWCLHAPIASGIDAVVIAHESSANMARNPSVCGTCLASTVSIAEKRSARIRTEWVLMTSGTTGMRASQSLITWTRLNLAH